MPDERSSADRPSQSPDDDGSIAPIDGSETLPEDLWEKKSWHNLWQVPTLLLSLALIAIGISLAVRNQPQNDFDGALDQVQRLIESKRFDVALAELRDRIEPNLDQASPAEEAKFHAIVGDWIYFSQAEQPDTLLENNQRIDRQYVKAVQLGLTMDVPRIERWALALLDSGDLDGARKRLAELDALDITHDGAEDIRNRRNRVFRRLIEQSLTNPNASTEEMLGMLAEYSEDRRLSIADQGWAVARKAGLRLEDGRTQDAVDHLLVDMRRLEQQSRPSDHVDFGTLYTLLGRGYFGLGRHKVAENQLTHALRLHEEHHPSRGESLALLGRIAFANTRFDDAHDRFDQVVREFVSTPSYLPGLLGRAEVRSVLGDHNGAMADYERLRQRLAKVAPRTDVNAERVADSLRDRHDAALASRRLDLALGYAQIAESYFSTLSVPTGILIRLASTSRALGEQQRAGLEESQEATGDPGATGDPLVHRQANLHFKRSGDYYVKYARVMASRADADEQWAEALWLGADAYDGGGWHDLAIQHFREYIGGRSTDDPKLPEVMFRLAQAHHAQLEFDIAADTYLQVINDHGRSRFASSSNVPLARCLLMLNRHAEAEEQLLQVVQGRRLLTPDAADFRAALFELGLLYHASGDFTHAIERLTEGLERYPDDERALEIRFHLADSNRGRAADLRRQLDDETRLPPSERERLDDLRVSHLHQAMTDYTGICDTLADALPGNLTRLEEDLRRWSYLYRADCAFLLGEFELAVELYDGAARRYGSHHSSMYALVQIVNCYGELGDLDQLQAAHKRALVRLGQLDPELFEAPDTLMDRAAWERWLTNTPVASDQTASAIPNP